MVEKLALITSKTMVPISFIAISWFIISWVSEVKNKADNNAVALTKNDTDHRQILKTLHEQTKKLSKIEGILELVRDKIK